MQTATPVRGAPRSRADARRNRERIVEAAREMFVERGPDVPMDEVARRAGVGNATVYRNFPDRGSLVREVVHSVMERTARAAERARAEGGDAFAALEHFAHVAADERVGALCPVLVDTFDEDHPDLVAGRDRVERGVSDLMERAKAAGQLRPDVAVGDLLLAVSLLSRPPAGTACLMGDRFVHRHLQLFLDGLRSPGRSHLPGTPATLGGLRRPHH
ncbi:MULTISPECIES: TetR/AcrR family transcriptional regulator [unclassified Streptomyces]|uniref:TetR/AcrR family transcriptional regulator n=1 Tax=unclassified Streptomyces TaxID=2593676 RepID=UPI001903CAE7|nr:TetR/AcrR family transcriptional regulator [Streptomyces sp. HSG2]